MSDFGHPEILVAVYRSCFDLLRSGCFTTEAAHKALQRFFGGYSVEEVAAALTLLVKTADLRVVEVEDVPGVVFVAGPYFPKVDLWPEASS